MACWEYARVASRDGLLVRDTLYLGTRTVGQTAWKHGTVQKDVTAKGTDEPAGAKRITAQPCANNTRRDGSSVTVVLQIRGASKIYRIIDAGARLDYPSSDGFEQVAVLIWQQI